MGLAHHGGPRPRGGQHGGQRRPALIASVGFAIYTVCLRTDTDRDWSPVLPGYGLLMIIVCGCDHAGSTARPWFHPGPDIAWALLHGAVIIVVGTVMFNAASKHVPAVPMTVFAQTEMVFVPIWGFIILDLQPKPLTIVGGARSSSPAVVGKAWYDAASGRRNDYTTAPDVPLL